MTDRLTFTVHGRPAPQGSKRHVGNGVMVESSKRLKPWREDVRAAALAAIGERALPVYPRGVPLQLRITFNFARPKSHYRSGKRSNELREDSPEGHANKPDTDKLLRAIGDALTGIVWTDDSQVSLIEAEKVWNDVDRMWLSVDLLDWKDWKKLT